MKLVVCQSFGQSISNYLVDLKIKDFNFTLCNFISNLMMLDINMFSFRVKGRIASQSYISLVSFFRRLLIFGVSEDFLPGLFRFL